MRKLKEKEIKTAKTGALQTKSPKGEASEENIGASIKAIQYLMLAVLFGLAFILPAYGVTLQVKESAGTQVESGNEKTGEAGGENTAGEKAGGENAAGENTAVGKGTIVIDAGHGGDDPGMIGASGISEKVLNLVYAKKLEVLLTDAGYRVVQTRTTEDGLYDADETHKKAQDMQRRVAVIAEEQPLLAVSIHQNSYPQDASVCGPQVFYYEHSAEGERLAKCIQTCMNEQLEIARPRVQKGNTSYYILKRSVSTTVIVECGFLTNPAEEAKLQEEEYQDKMTQAICDGILQYLDGTA